ncbi:restriction endonuclease [Streptomyces antnestii]|uniref:Restriction endonuclease n=1 Tax=Streptomyces antnestii TaxID=2494256 RepID=A0A437PCK5_9ACTN|nr:restriction endonuclease [Streptomyces sp. San01]
MSGRRRRSSARAGQNFTGVYAVAAVAAGTLAVATVRWLLANWWVLVVAAAVAVAGGAAWLYRRAERARAERLRMQGLRYELPRLDSLHHREFEFAVRDLMLRDGCGDARQVGGAGDNGVDVLATDPAGRRWVIQCKHRRDGDRGAAVGTPDLQRVNGTARPLHRADVVVVVTNGRFSAKCPTLARQLDMHLVDRRTLATWAAGSRPLWELLPRVPPPRRPSPLP